MTFPRLQAAAVVAVLLMPGAAAAAPRPRDPPRLEIVTVPAIAGIEFRLDGIGFESGSDGVARIQVPAKGPHLLTTTVLQRPARGVRARLIRWEDGAPLARRALQLSGGRTRIRVGFTVSALTTFVFVDPRGRRLPSGMVQAIELETHDGKRMLMRGERSRWLTARVAVARRGHLRQSHVRYAVERVLAAGSNVVNRGQQRFSSGGRVRIDVLFFSVRISVRDAFYGFPIGSWVTIEYPDHHTARRRLHGGRAVIGPLPRGNYVLKVNSAGVGNERELVVSRDAVASVRILSYYDGLTVAGLFVLSSLALFAIGRGRRFRSRSPTMVSSEEAERL
jgi:hypothetical protein